MTQATSVYQQLRTHLTYLRLEAAADALAAELDVATKQRLSHTAFLSRMLAIEAAATEERRLAGRRRFCPHRGASRTSASTRSPSSTASSSTSWRRYASSRRRRTSSSSDHLESARPCWPWDSDTAPSRPATASTTRPQRSSLRDVTAPPSKAGGRHARASTRAPVSSSSTSWGICHFRQKLAAALFQVVSQRYLKGSVVLTTNRGIASWGSIFNDDPVVAAAMLDRLLHRSVVVNIDGESYRMRSHHAQVQRLRAAAGASSKPEPTERSKSAPV